MIFENCHRDYILLQRNKIKITFLIAVIADSVKIAMNGPTVCVCVSKSIGQVRGTLQIVRLRP